MAKAGIGHATIDEMKHLIKKTCNELREGKKLFLMAAIQAKMAQQRTRRHAGGVKTWVDLPWNQHHLHQLVTKRKLTNPKANVCYTDMCIYILHSPTLNVSILVQMPRITTTIKILIHICSLMKKHPPVSTPSTAW